FGLTAIKNVGEGAIESLLAVRKTHGRIASMASLAEDIDLRLANKRVFESLIKAGAMDGLAESTPVESLPSRSFRPRLFAAVDSACEYGSRIQRDRDEGQAQLFGGFDALDGGNGHGSTALTTSLPETAPWTESEQLAFEKETLGLYWSGHPVD